MVVNMAFNYSIRKNGAIIIIDLIGELKVSDLADYSGLFEDTISDDSKYIIINMQHLTYIDSTAIGLIVNFKREIDKHSGIILICCIPHDIRNVFEITGIAKYIPTFESEAEAIDEADRYIASDKSDKPS